MGAFKEEAVQAPRAKALRPCDSGVYRAVHRGESSFAANDAQALHAAPERRASTRRADMQRTLALVLANALRADDLSDSDAAAACDRARQHVLDMRSPDGRAITLADGVLIARVSPTFRAAMVEMFGAQR